MPFLTVNIAAVRFALCVLLAGPLSGLFAADGAIEINGARASAGGVTASDAPGFPVTIDQTGSYILTGGLIVPNGDTTAIEVLDSFVTIDLNGFTIEGPTRCADETCGPTGTGFGIVSRFGDTTVRNGFIIGMGSHGLVLRLRAVVERVHVSNNGGHGIECLTCQVRGELRRRERWERYPCPFSQSCHGQRRARQPWGRNLCGL